VEKKETAGSADLRALRTAIDLLTAGHRLVMFPEGTRSRDGKLRGFQPGVAMMFLRSKAPLVPIYVHGSYRVLPRNAKSPHVFRKIKVFVGEPILFEQVPTGMRSKKQHEWILNELHSRISALQHEAWERYPLPLPPPDADEDRAEDSAKNPVEVAAETSATPPTQPPPTPAPTPPAALAETPPATTPAATPASTEVPPDPAPHG
jgi:hypothetical protein